MIRDVHHAGIVVRSLETALALYRDTLGLEVVKEGSAGGLRVAIAAAGRSYLEILEPLEPDSPFAQHIEERGEGLHHLALWVEDVEAMVTGLRERGVAPADATPREGFTGRRSCLRPEAFDGALLEVVQPEKGLSGAASSGSAIKGIDHVVLRVPDVGRTVAGFEEWLGVPVKRRMERGDFQFAFMRPGEVIIEVIGPKSGGEPGSGAVAGLAFEVEGIDELTARVKAGGYPIGAPHPALQGGRIVSVHRSGACGVALAFIDFTGSPGPPAR
jgi:methylmalonyl-CoA/ethylmalonyl-CoA epimerase